VSDVLVLKTGTTLDPLRARRGDYEDWIVAGLGISAQAARVVAVFEGESLPAPDSPAAVVVTGSSAMVSERAPWSETAAAWLRDAAHAGTPVLGICYGHQLLGLALGGHVGANPRGREMGTVRVGLHAAGCDDALLGSLGSPLRVQTTHLESLLELPPGETLLAGNGTDPHHALAWGTRAWGVQFHPEFDADVMRAYLEARREILRSEGIDPDALVREVAETPQGPELLRRFAALCGL
jgi:GMP synthase (glutamine-hydrolysing)